MGALNHKIKSGRTPLLGMAAVCLSLLTLPANSATAGWLIGGKYHRWTLETQWGVCNGGDCDGCMNEMWPNPFNPFWAGDDPNCNGVWPWPLGYTNKLYRWGTGDWYSFIIIGGYRELENTIDACHQNHNDWNCVYASEVGPVPVPGAYYVGSQLGLLELDGMIDRTQIGWPTDWSSYDLAQFDVMKPYIEEVIQEMTFADLGWTAIFRGAAMYYYENELGDLPPPTILGTDGTEYPIDANFASEPPAIAGATVAPVSNSLATSGNSQALALKVMAHAFVASESWELHSGILQENGISPFCTSDNDDCAPTVVYVIWAAFSDIVRPYVKSEDSTWGSVKDLYRGGGE
jgi:hypothetical protein